MKENPNSGHRARLLKRFEESGISALADYEIIELLLSYAIPRRDTKPIAKKLIGSYKTLRGVINAHPDELKSVEGIGPRAALIFPLVKEILSYCLKEKYQRQEVMAHRRDVEEFLLFQFGLKHDEYVAALFLDSGNHVLTTDVISEGTVNQCAVYPRRIIGQAVRCGAASIIMAHNHPGGGKNPSEEDWQITERLFQIGKLMEIPLLDHILITGEEAFSWREHSRWPS
jgi:DNA repair protein RadC